MAILYHRLTTYKMPEYFWQKARSIHARVCIIYYLISCKGALQIFFHRLSIIEFRRFHEFLRNENLSNKVKYSNDIIDDAIFFGAKIWKTWELHDLKTSVK